MNGAKDVRLEIYGDYWNIGTFNYGGRRSLRDSQSYDLQVNVSRLIVNPGQNPAKPAETLKAAQQEEHPDENEHNRNARNNPSETLDQSLIRILGLNLENDEGLIRRSSPLLSLMSLSSKSRLTLKDAIDILKIHLASNEEHREKVARDLEISKVPVNEEGLPRL